MATSPEPDTDPREQLLADEESNFWNSREKVKTRKCPCLCMIILYSLSIAILFTVGTFFGYHFQDLNASCIQYVAQYSPLLRDMDVTYHVQQFNGSFLHENIYRQDASPEVDAAWEALGVDYRPLKVSPEDADKAGISHGHVKIDDKYGGGFPANMEGLHHLHCLNLLRKSLFYNYDYYHDQGEGAFINDDYIIRRHVSHCLDILRQQLMCTVDVGVLGQVWVWPNDPQPFVDFNTQHRCRNYDQIRQWAYDHQLPEDPPGDYIQQHPAKGDKVFSEIP